MNSINVISCPTWEDFILLARSTQSGRTGPNKIFRGHANENWLLSSSFERWLDNQRGYDQNASSRSSFGPRGPEGFEEHYLHRFKNTATGIPNLDAQNLTDDDWWILGRHHGLMTRLLDWTYSPYIAAFFAFAGFAETQFDGFESGIIRGPLKHSSSKVVIWTLALYDKLFIENEFELLPNRKQDFYRQKAQRGLFTRLRHDIHLNIEAYLKQRKQLHFLERIEIPSLEVGKALNDLRLMNISYSTLFPDVDGAAKEANLAPIVSRLGWSGSTVKIVHQ